MKITLFTLFLCMGLGLYSQASFTIEGQVVDPHNAPIAYAHITLFDDPTSDNNVVTNEEGFFALHITPSFLKNEEK